MAKFKAKFKVKAKPKAKVKAKVKTKAPKAKGKGLLKKVAIGAGLGSILGGLSQGEDETPNIDKSTSDLADSLNNPEEDTQKAILTEGINNKQAADDSSSERNLLTEELKAKKELTEEEKIVNEAEKHDKRTEEILQQYGLRSSLLKETKEEIPQGIPHDYLSKKQISRAFNKKTHDPRLDIIMQLLAAHNELIGQVSFSLGILVKQHSISPQAKLQGINVLKQLIIKDNNTNSGLNADDKATPKEEKQDKQVIQQLQDLNDSATEEKSNSHLGKALGVGALLGVEIPLVQALVGSLVENFGGSDEEKTSPKDDKELEDAINKTNKSVDNIAKEVKNYKKVVDKKNKVHKGEEVVHADTEPSPRGENPFVEKQNVTSLSSSKPYEKITEDFKFEVQPLVQPEGIQVDQPTVSKVETPHNIQSSEPKVSNSNSSKVETPYKKYAYGGFLSPIGGYFPWQPGYTERTLNQEIQEKPDQKQESDKEVELESQVDTQQKQLDKLHALISTYKEKDGTTKIAETSYDLKVEQIGITPAILEVMKEVERLRKEIHENSKGLRGIGRLTDKGLARWLDNAIAGNDENMNSQDEDESILSEYVDLEAEGQVPPQGIFSGSKKNFVSAFYPRILRTLKEKGINEAWAPIIAAQWSLESGWGSKPTGNYNYGGFKASPQEDGKVNPKDGQRYKNFKDINDYINTAIDRLRNRFHAFDGEPSPNGFAVRLKQHGYYGDSVQHYSSVVSQNTNSIISLAAELGGTVVTANTSSGRSIAATHNYSTSATDVSYEQQRKKYPYITMAPEQYKASKEKVKNPKPRNNSKKKSPLTLFSQTINTGGNKQTNVDARQINVTIEQNYYG